MKDWYKKSFDLDYLKVYAHRDDNDAIRALDLIEHNLPLNKDDMILDLCCGNGRHTMRLGSRGYNCIGLDLSRDLLLDAQNNSSVSLNLIRGDMRHIPFINQFDVILNLFTSFGYFDNDADNFSVIETVACALKTSGRFVMDYLNRDFVFANLVPRSERTLEDGRNLKEERKLILDKSTIHKIITISSDNSVDEYVEVLRVYEFDEIREMMKHAGLTVRKTFGGFNGEKYDSQKSRRLIIFAEKE